MRVQALRYTVGRTQPEAGDPASGMHAGVGKEHSSLLASSRCLQGWLVHQARAYRQRDLTQAWRGGAVGKEGPPS